MITLLDYGAGNVRSVINAIEKLGERITVAEDVRRAIADGYDAKYPYRPTGAEFWRVTPDHVLAWKTDTIEAFASTPTQFDFGGLA